MAEIILSLTRGGQASYPNQDRAIALAKERGAELLFLYVTDVSFLGLTAAPKVVNLEKELDEMGEFLLVMAQERARKAGVEAHSAVRRGEFREVIQEIIREQPIDTVTMGYAGSEGVTTPEYINALAQEISQEMAVEFVVLQDGEIASMFPPE